jgi:protoporphyrinogen oxidase
MTGYCVELTCRVGDDRWNNAERLTDWVLDDLVKVGMLKSRRRVIDVKIERIKDSYPIYKRNYPEALDAARRKPRGRSRTCTSQGARVSSGTTTWTTPMENAMQLTSKLLRDRLHVPAQEARASVS